MDRQHTADYALFETSWEVCNKVGGIYTVVSTKAKTLVEKLGDDYVLLGPWRLGDEQSEGEFEAESGFESFTAACREMGVPARVGRWKIPGAPRTILVEFSSLFARNDEILAELWEHYEVDSLTGGWEYVEPLLFGYAAGMVIERWYDEFVSPKGLPGVAQFHEWMTGAGLLYLKRHAPEMAHVFTTHATILGRSMASTGHGPQLGLGGREPAQIAAELGVRSKHSMETVCARESDAFTTVSEITALEADLLLGREPKPVLPNGIDLEVIDAISDGVDRERSRAALSHLAHRFLGELDPDAAFLCISGRYEFYNKGIDMLLEALARLARTPGRPVVLFATIPAGQSGVCNSLRERLEAPEIDPDIGPLGVSTHNLIDQPHDPIQQAVNRLGLLNARGARVKVIQIPIYLSRDDDLLGFPYEGMLRGIDLTCFPSYYEPWGYTPEESLAAGVPTVTTDLAGFGRWVRNEGLSDRDGVYVLERDGVDDEPATVELTAILEGFLASEIDPQEMAETCRRTALKTAWTDLVAHYYEAFESAIDSCARRRGGAARRRYRAVQVPVVSAREGVQPRLLPFNVEATLPESLDGLKRLSRNFWWCWDHEATCLFRELSPESWERSGQNPVMLLRRISPEDLQRTAEDANYVARLQRTLARFDAYVEARHEPLELGNGHALDLQHPVAYFSAEFGLHESLAIYSGGLGILAGDHLKSASDIGLPLVGIGLFYSHGYLKQGLTPEGEQVALPSANDASQLPMELVRDADGNEVRIELQLPSRTLHLRAWRVDVGRIRLFLLDSNFGINLPEDREITAKLYGGDQEMRLCQEITLGRGGSKLLRALGLDAPVWHLNEGHAAFAVLERLRQLVSVEGMTFAEAREYVRSSTAFTTHTPVPAGHDRFGEDLMRRYFSDAPARIGVSWDDFVRLGQIEGDVGTFNMTYLAVHFAGAVNGVSKLHGEVSRELLDGVWPGLLQGEVPVGHVTNGIHLPSWTHPDLAALLGAEGRPVNARDFQDRAAELDLPDLWRVRGQARRGFLEAAKHHLRQGMIQGKDSPRNLSRLIDGLDENALLIGFARRFAPYKRAQLLFQDLNELAKILNDEERPVRIFFAGKAHPADGRGQNVMRQVIEITRREEFLGKIFFLENYDIELARSLVQGVDVWLNTPIRGLEASGTSGMKAAANGALNLSILDGWWVEGYDGGNGWSIGDGRLFDDQHHQDEFDSAELYRQLRDVITPLFFERDAAGVPRSWLERARHCLATIPPFFDTDRMVGEYRDTAYVPLARNHFDLVADHYAEVKRRAAMLQRVRAAFESVRIIDARVTELTDLRVGDRIDVHVHVDTAGLEPSELAVEMVLGHQEANNGLAYQTIIALTPDSNDRRTGPVAFDGSHRLERSGHFAYGIRVRARSIAPFQLGLRDLVRWG